MRRIAHDHPDAKSARPLPPDVPAFSAERALAEDAATEIVTNVLEHVLGAELPRAALMAGARRALASAELRSASGQQGPELARQLRAVVDTLERGSR